MISLHPVSASVSATRSHRLILIFLMYHHSHGINDHACVQASTHTCTLVHVCAHTHTYTIHTYTHTTASGKDAGLDHEYGLVDCITIVYISACDTTMPPRACDRGIHTHTIVQLAFAWSMGDALQRSPRDCSRMFTRREASPKIRSKTKQNRFFRSHEIIVCILCTRS